MVAAHAEDSLEMDQLSAVSVVFTPTDRSACSGIFIANYYNVGSCID